MLCRYGSLDPAANKSRICSCVFLLYQIVKITCLCFFWDPFRPSGLAGGSYTDELLIVMDASAGQHTEAMVGSRRLRSLPRPRPRPRPKIFYSGSWCFCWFRFLFFRLRFLGRRIENLFVETHDANFFWVCSVTLLSGVAA